RGMSKSQVFNRCGSPVREYKTRQVEEKWADWGRGYGLRNTRAVHEKFLMRNNTWVGNKSKIFLFRNDRLYEMFDYGTGLRTPRLPKKHYGKGPLELEQERLNAEKKNKNKKKRTSKTRRKKR
ncbi:unnamed protein product, partial [marine sediment metagenome]